MASHGYGTINNRVAIANSHMRKEERQPLLLNSEPLNDSYDKRTLPRPDVRASPDNVLNLTGGSLDSSLAVDTKLDEKSEMGSSSGNTYDPILDRNLQHPTSNLDTMIHLLKGNIGTGILAMPDGFRNAGLVIGTLGTLLMGAICTHCMHILVRCSHELCRKRNVPSLGFSEVVESSFITGPSFIQKHSKPAKILVNVFLCITQLGFCCVYFVFVAVNIKDVLSHYGNYHFHTYQYLLMLLVPMILLNWVKNLKFLTPVSLFAAVVTVVGLGITFFYMLQGLPRSSTVRKFAPWKQLPLFFGTVIYAFEGIGVVLPLENNMKNPQDFGGWTGVLNTGMAIVAVLYTSVGFFGYLKYGEKAKLGSITLNLPQNDLLAQSVRLMMAVAIFLSYGLQFYVPMGIIWPIVEPHLVSERSKVIGEYVLRTILVTFTLCLAIAIPNLGAVISLVGAISSSTLALIFPPLIEIITFSDDLGPYKWVLWKDIVIMCFGLCGFGFGTYASIANILAPQD